MSIHGSGEFREAIIFSPIKSASRCRLFLKGPLPLVNPGFRVPVNVFPACSEVGSGNTSGIPPLMDRICGGSAFLYYYMEAEKHCQAVRAEQGPDLAYLDFVAIGNHNTSWPQNKSPEAHGMVFQKGKTIKKNFLKLHY